MHILPLLILKLNQAEGESDEEDAADDVGEDARLVPEQYFRSAY